MGVTLAPLGPGFPHFAVLRGSFLHFVYAFISYASFRKKTRKQTDGLRVLQSLTREFLLLKNSRKFIKKCENAIIPPATKSAQNYIFRSSKYDAERPTQKAPLQKPHAPKDFAFPLSRIFKNNIRKYGKITYFQNGAVL